MRRLLALSAIAVCLLAACCTAVPSSDAVLPPPPEVVLKGTPPVMASEAAALERYTAFRPTLFSDWHPTRVEMLVIRRQGNTPQVHRLVRPGGALERLTNEPEPVRSAHYQPTEGGYYLLTKDTGGNEVFRAYRRTPGSDENIPVTPEGQRMSGLTWLNSGRQVVYSVVPVNRQGSTDAINTEVFLADPLHPETARRLVSLAGGGWGGFTPSPDDTQLAFVQSVSATESYLWVLDVATGQTRRIAGKRGDVPVAYGQVRFSHDGRGVYTVCDWAGEFHSLAYVDVSTGALTPLATDIAHDVDGFDLSDDGRWLAVVFNEDGLQSLKLMRTTDHRWVGLPPLPQGSIGGVKWHNNSVDLAFTLASAKTPSDIYSLNIDTQKVTRWTTHEKLDVDATAFPEPELIHWTSFDGRKISGFLYRAPAAKFPGPRPVLISIHGGPEGQYQPGFLGRSNYLLMEMGISLLFPNVRGSSGYGKSFLKLDDGYKREDSVKDIGSLLDWIGTQPDLDAKRVVVRGGSYGGYMSLAVATTYPDRIAGAIDSVGISNFVTFLERTESYRRDLRRVEYGDERDPQMRAWMEEIAPLNRAGNIRKPLFVLQGKNDPRVPWQEADQIVRTVEKNGTPVWYMLANNEGHGFSKKANADYEFCLSVAFLRQILLGGH